MRGPSSALMQADWDGRAATLRRRWALQRAAILSNEKFRGVRLVLADGELKIICTNTEQEEAEEQLEVPYQAASPAARRRRNTRDIRLRAREQSSKQGIAA